MQTTTMNNDAIASQFSETITVFINRLSAVATEGFNKIPFESSWTPAQVGDHVLKFLTGTSQALSLPQEEAGRTADVNIQTLKDIFLNFDQKVKAPAFVEPDKGPIEKEALINSLKAINTRIMEFAKNNKLNTVCKGADFPTIGEMTGWEWLHFAIYHVQRHTYQLEKMEEVIGN